MLPHSLCHCFKKTHLHSPNYLRGLFKFGSHRSPHPSNMMKTLLLEIMDHYRVAGLSFATGILVTLASSLIPAIWHCPTNPFLGQMVQLRKKRSRLASRPGGLSQFDLTDHYGLEQQVLNLDFNAQTMWMNVGFWKVCMRNHQVFTRNISTNTSC